MRDARRAEEHPISLNAPRPAWAQKPLPDIVSHEEEVRLPGGTSERLYIPPSPPWVRGRELFLRGMGATFVVAFASLAVQATGLLGPSGVAPMRHTVEVLQQQQISFIEWPSIARVVPLFAERPALFAWIGVLFGVAMIAGFLPPLAAFGAWAIYLSCVTLGGPFLSFQWDALLLEAGFLALLVSPWTLRLTRARSRPVAAPLRWCLWFLVGRLLLLSALVKILSGSAPWRDGTALDFHWWTQPLPNPVSWWMAQFPLWSDRLFTFGSIAMELAVPVLICFGRWPRAVAALLVIAQQIGITATGNYGFFNLLTAVLALSLIDDDVLRRVLRRPLNVPIPVVVASPAATARALAVTLGVATALLVAVPSSIGWLQRVAGRSSGPFDALPSWMASALSVPFEFGSRWRLASGYGLFAHMTVERPELIIEASRDRIRWEPYRFRWKPGPIDRRPPSAFLHMPRLDWQMWFAALAWPAAEQWQASLNQALLEARPEVLALLESAPLGNERPRAVRWRRDRYEFSTLGTTAAQDGAWWIVVEEGRPVQGFSRR